MIEDKFRYSRFGLINALLSLIPLFPAWTLFPGILFGTALGVIIDDCELGFLVTLWTCFGLVTILLLRFFNRPAADTVKTAEKQSKKEFRFFYLQIYTLTNTAVLIMIVGTNLVCHGDGQTLLSFVLSGPIASIGLILLGVAVDIKVRINAPNKV